MKDHVLWRSASARLQASEQSPSRLEAPLLRFSAALSLQRAHGLIPKAQSKRKASQKMLVKLVKLAFAGLLTNDTLLGKAFSCTLAGMN